MRLCFELLALNDDVVTSFGRECRGVDVHKNDGYFLIKSVDKGSVDAILHLIGGGVDVDYSNCYGDTALIHAARRGDLILVKELLKNGTNVNHANSEGETALHVASMVGRLLIVKCLIEKGGADINLVTKYGHTPLDNARVTLSKNPNDKNCKEVVNYLWQRTVHVMHNVLEVSVEPQVVRRYVVNHSI